MVDNKECRDNIFETQTIYRTKNQKVNNGVNRQENNIRQKMLNDYLRCIFGHFKDTLQFSIHETFRWCIFPLLTKETKIFIFQM